MSRRVVDATAVKAALVDVVGLIVFVVMGRSSHQESASISEAAKVLAPFAIALAIAWLVARAWRTPLAPIPTGMVLWLVTAGGGLLLRRFAFQRSTAMGFVIVGSVFLLLTTLGWRMIADWWRERRHH